MTFNTSWKASWKLYTVIVSDIILTILSYWLSYLLRFNFAIPDIYMGHFLKSCPVLVALRVITFHVFGLYKGMWRYASMNDLIRILKAITAGTVVFSAYVAFYFMALSFPRSVIIIDWFIIITFLGGSRFVYRFFREFKGMSTITNGKKVLIIGASDEGEMLLRELKKNPKMNYKPVGFLDRSTERKGRRIHDVPVLGVIEDLGKIIRKKKVEEVIVADPSINGKAVREIMTVCRDNGVHCKTVPAIADILRGRINITQIREINIEDLLGREHIELDREKIKAYLSGKRVMVTGAAGSIGSELCRQIMGVEPEKLILYERVENELYNIMMEFSESNHDRTYVAILGDILDAKRLEDVMKTYKPQVIFHTAAYKHVPITEAHPYESVRNNIIGTMNVALCSAKCNVEKFVLISTDKAVEPISIMGATKRVAELICQGLNQIEKTRYIAVRFGNVLNSAGSVIPLFKQQIERGGPITITHPAMTRYFMSIPEAVQLVMQAGAMGKGGEIFVLEMGEPVKIVDLANDMIKLMGYSPEDIEIIYTGLRPGERIEEILIGEDEEVEVTSHEKIMLLKTPLFDWQDMKRRLDEFIAKTSNLNEAEIKETLFSIIKRR
ncbi:MAG TPA: nucleoside-diphosphate sugar epimerase [Deltaproteobacteria bacterium]|nr:nucleoside-diphosphate sugar epimerase [Deltaproteobacteria bacterium]